METIKLVVWDMDETFWKGTLSEGEIEIIQENISIVKELTDRGIMNSICSKNSFKDVEKKLKDLNIWEYFVFPQISWNAKGKAIQHIIDSMHLRAVNVLFLDDNHLNLEEAKFYNEDLQVLMPHKIKDLLLNPALKGKDDKKHSRLQQYKLLEKKHETQSGSQSNEEFLMSSQVKVRIIQNLEGNKERLAELIGRTNQLNYTKKRLTDVEVDALIADEGLEKGLIEVFDRFGEYGITGFYALNKSNNELEHFLFSCRILNLGIENYIYEWLGYPSVEIIPDVVSPLSKNEKIDWIELIEEKGDRSINKDNKHKPKLLLKGGCDLRQMLFYLENDFLMEEEINYVNKNNLNVRYEHTDILLQVYKNEIPEQHNLPFWDENIYKTQFFKTDSEVIVLSVLMDYTHVEFQHKSGYYLPYGDFDMTAIDEEELYKRYKRKKIFGINKEFIKSFQKEYTYQGLIRPERFIKNLEEIRSFLPQKKPIVFINGSEQIIAGSEKETERHKIMNTCLDEFIDKHDNCYLLDLRKIVQKPNLHTDSIRHYQRFVYVNMAEELRNLIFGILKINKSTRKKKTAHSYIAESDFLYEILIHQPRNIKRRMMKYLKMLGLKT